MKRILTLTFALMFMLTCMAMANPMERMSTRVMSMGEVGNVVKDYSNIWMYPQTILQYPGQFHFESEDYDEEITDMGANWAIGEGVLGVYFTEMDYETYFGTSMDSDVDHRISLVYGTVMGEMPVGINFNFYNESMKNEDEWKPNNYDWSMRRFEILLGATAMEGALDVSAYFGSTSWKDEDVDYFGTVFPDTALAEISSPDGNSDLGLMGRYWMEPRGKWQMIPHFAFGIHKEGIAWNRWDGSALVADDSREFKVTMLDLGIGTNYNVSDDVMTVTDFGFYLWKETYTFNDEDNQAPDTSYEWEDKETVLPYFKIGLDAKVNKWLDLRCGVTNRWESDNETRTYTDPANYDQDRTWGDSNTDMYLGFGCHWGDLYIDGYMEDCTEWLHEGPYFLTGDESDWATRISVSYYFD